MSHPNPFQPSSSTARRQPDGSITPNQNSHSRRLFKRPPYHPPSPTTAATQVAVDIPVATYAPPFTTLQRSMLHILAVLQLETALLDFIAHLPVHPPLMHIHARKSEERNMKYTIHPQHSQPSLSLSVFTINQGKPGITHKIPNVITSAAISTCPIV